MQHMPDDVVCFADVIEGSLHPSECLMTQKFTTVGPDNNLDVVVSLLSFGSYPNVCFHKEKRKILTTEGRAALIHKSSVNCPFSSHDMTYPSPFFVFSEKVQGTETVTRVSKITTNFVRFDYFQVLNE